MFTDDEEDTPSILQQQQQQQQQKQKQRPGCPKPTSAPPLVRDTPHLNRHQHEEAISTETNFLLGVKSQLEDDITTLQSANSILRARRNPLRWNKHTRSPRHTAHPHPLRLVHTSTIYNTFGGRFMCDIHGGEWQRPTYVFHCPICLFDVCLQCVAKPCSNCSEQECCHTRITIDLL